MTPEDIAARMDGIARPAGIAAAGGAGAGLGQEAVLPSPVVQNHAAFLCRLPDGAVICAWFGGSLEGKSDICIRAAVLPAGGADWGPVSTLTDDPGRSEQNPVIFRDPADGTLLLLHTAQVSGNQDGARVMMRRLSLGPDGRISAGPPRDTGLPGGTFIRAPITVLEDGSWLLPLFLCTPRPGQRWTGSDDTAAIARSTDRGESWQVSHVPGSEGSVHMTVVPLGGPRMAAFYRRRQADFVHRSESLDGGRSWSAPVPTDVPNNNSSIGVIRCGDGRLAMLCNPASAATSAARRASLYDELGEEDDRPDAAGAIRPIWGVPRAPLALCFSADEGRSFPERRLVADAAGTCLSNDSLDGRNQELSYPVLIEHPDGTLDLAWTLHRRAIAHRRLPPGAAAMLPAVEVTVLA